MNAATPTARLTRRDTRKITAHERLLQIAQTVFAEKGYKEATMRSIADACGCSTGLIFGHVGNKEELFAAVLDRAWTEDVERIRSIAQQYGDVVELLMNIFSVDGDRQFAQLPMLRMKFSLWWANKPYTSNHMNRVRQNMQACPGLVLENASRNGQLSGDLVTGPVAEILWDIFVGEYRRMLTVGQILYDWDRHLRSKVEMVLEAYRTE